MRKKLDFSIEDIERAKIRGEIIILNKKLSGICRASRGGDYEIINRDIQSRMFGAEAMKNFSKKNHKSIINFLDSKTLTAYYQALLTCVDKYNDFYNTTDGIRKVIQEVFMQNTKLYKFDLNLEDSYTIYNKIIKHIEKQAEPDWLTKDFKRFVDMKNSKKGYLTEVFETAEEKNARIEFSKPHAPSTEEYAEVFSFDELPNKDVEAQVCEYSNNKYSLATKPNHSQKAPRTKKNVQNRERTLFNFNEVDNKKAKTKTRNLFNFDEIDKELDSD